MSRVRADMRFASSIIVVVTAILGTHCASAPGPVESKAAPAGEKEACEPLEKLGVNCPPDWAAANADSRAFCAEHKDRTFKTFVSTEACRGQLHYTRYLFDAGPRYCLYDPTTKKLTGYGAFDGKINYRAQSCGMTSADFDDKGCAIEMCPE